MKVLCVSTHALFPGSRFGGSKRAYYLAKTLDARAELDLIHFDSSAEVASPETFAPPFRRQLFLPRQPLSFAELGPMVPGTAKALRKHRDAVTAFIGDRRYDVTLLLFASALYLIDPKLVPHPGRILYLEDDLLIERLRAEARTDRSFFRRLFKRARLAQARRFYRRKLRSVFGFLSISEQEAAIARREWGLPVRLLGYGIPLEEYPELPLPEGSPVLGFIGNYGHSPNIDAARWLAESVFPALRARMPEARLVFCGAGFPADLREACAREPGIEVMGEVADLSAFYERISVFVNPIREGRGLRTKMVESAAYGRPLLSTALGAEGLESLEIGLFENGEELAAEVAALAKPGIAQAIARKNRAEVERLFSLDAVGGDLFALLEEAARGGTA